ncbi:MAG: 1-(5-phosphoribosyl)-5-[(5-phosphoribosylamino)methylideneamino]imidazole-4-carboxamide isomerase, partial [Nitrososphaerales archaeon]
MDIIPAVDIMDNNVVRLTKGISTDRTIYDGTPMDWVKRWSEEGANLIHVVDLDATLGQGQNSKLVEKMVTSLPGKLQVGGGIRDSDAARQLLDAGAQRIVLGTLAQTDPSTIAALLQEYGKDRIVVSLDYSSGEVMIGGWKEGSGKDLSTSLVAFQKIGVELFLLTCIERDGTLERPDLTTIRRARAMSDGIIASGGIRDKADLVDLRKVGVNGAIIGKSLYEGKIDLKDALNSSRG